MMAGAVSVLQAAGCALVGGHTCEGAEQALGFSITVGSQTYSSVSFLLHCLACGNLMSFNLIDFSMLSERARA